MGDPKAVEGMARFGIQSSNSFGVSVPKLRALARTVGRDHLLAMRLWETGLHDARLLATMVDDPDEVTIDQMDKWVRDFDSWDVVDGSCGNLFDKTPFAVAKAKDWCKREEEFVKRAGFVLMAELAVHDKEAKDKVFLDFLPVVIGGASDSRNFVKKAVNWSLRQIGKRNLKLNKAAVSTALKIQKIDSGAAKWIASDALRELKSPQVLKRLRENK
ncbi:DNA alkylation repair protein [Candidatus Bathyarchaeota archaeon]|nr:MAG: DNA alkylation repair protein [Candidatus Bathyarchaeota archaeon]